jgi:MinD-like ATPase involved in chromosome partitioning or flagellar assembly
MNNDTPQVFGDDTYDHPDDPGPFSEPGDEAFPPFRGRPGWGQRVAPVAPDDDYPAGSGPGQPGYPRGHGHASGSEYARSLGYPQGPAADYPFDVRHTPDPSHRPDLGYRPDLEYVPEAGYPPDYGYPADPGFATDPGYGGELGLVHEADIVPPMEPLPDPAELPVVPAPVASPRDMTQPPDLAPPRDMGWPRDPAPAMSVPPAAGIPAARNGRRALWDEEPVAPPRPADQEYARETSDSLTTESLLHGKRAVPGSGWRRGVYRVTGGLLRFGESAADMRRRDLINRVRTPVAGGHHRVAVLSLKGGVGKTTTAVGLGATLATLRGDRVIAVDANPDRGTLSDKVQLETAATIRDLLNERDQVSRYADVRAFTSQMPSRLEVLASDRDPAVSVAFGADDYGAVARVLEHFYSVSITDCGTGLLHSAMTGVLRLADQMILVSSPSVDGARSASATLDWLEAHHCGDLVSNGVVVLSAIRPKSKSTVDLDRLEHHFASRCRAVVRIPYDPHLEEGAEVDLDLLGSNTAEAYLTLAAVVGDGLAWPRRLTSPPGGTVGW